MRKTLGRGLDAILGDVARDYSNNLSNQQVLEIDLDKISPNPYQPRKIFDEKEIKELSDSIVEHGLLQPIIVIDNPIEAENYWIVAGERRFRACKLAGMPKVRAIVAKIDAQDSIRMRELALIENIQRKDLNPVELAITYSEILKSGNLTHDALARKIKKSRASVTNTLRLLTLSPQVQNAITEDKIKEGHAKILAGLNIKEQENLLTKIIEDNLSVHELSMNLKSSTLDSMLKGLQINFKRLGLKSKVRKNGLLLDLSTQEEIKKLESILQKANDEK